MNVDDIDLSTSYLGLLAPWINDGSVTILGIGADESPHPFRSVSKTPHIVIIVLDNDAWRRVPTLLSQNKRETYEAHQVHFVFDSGKGIGSLVYRFYCLRQIRAAMEGSAFTESHIFGLEGAVWKPNLIVPLRRNIVDYVNTVAFRYLDSPLKILAKRILGYLPCALVWKGPIVLVGTRRGAVREDGRYQRFSVITDDREISFLFNKEGIAPFAVYKKGPKGLIDNEYHNQLRAFEILGNRVPEIYEYREKDDFAALTIEYVKEHTLSNIVAGAMFKRKKVFALRVVELIDFFIKIFSCFMDNSVDRTEKFNREDLIDFLGSVKRLNHKAVDLHVLGRCLELADGIDVPLIMQHGDFCVRNVLWAGGGRKVLIDWEDMDEAAPPLLDYTLLILSIKSLFKRAFPRASWDTFVLHALGEALSDAEAKIARLLQVDKKEFAFLCQISLASLCHRNIAKRRFKTARAILEELQSGAGTFLSKYGRA